MASLSTSDGYLESLADEAKKNDAAFMDIIKEFPVIYNRACADFKDRNIKNNAWHKISGLLDKNPSVSKDTKALEQLFQGTYGRHLGKVALAEMTFS